MRTKSVILGAALLAAGVASSMAQSNVYSLNVVGYINLTLTPGLSCVANQLDADGTGTNNTLTNVFGSNLPNGSTVYKFVSGSPLGYGYSHNAWAGSAAGVSLNPGEACFVQLPASVTTNITITTVGQVLQGTWTNNLTPPITLVSSIAPLSGTIDSTGNGGLNYVPSPGDTLYIWTPSITNYDAYTYSHGHFGTDPIISVGEGLFISSTNTAPWTNTFAVQ